MMYRLQTFSDYFTLRNLINWHANNSQYLLSGDKDDFDKDALKGHLVKKKKKQV